MYKAQKYKRKLYQGAGAARKERKKEKTAKKSAVRVSCQRLQGAKSSHFIVIMRPSPLHISDATLHSIASVLSQVVVLPIFWEQRAEEMQAVLAAADKVREKALKPNLYT